MPRFEQRTADVGSPLVIMAHPGLQRSRVSAIWASTLEAQRNVSVRILAHERGREGFDVKAEQAALELHQRIVFAFPFRWYSAPPLLAEWLEVVFEHGWAYGPHGTALEGKELALAISTWSRADDYTAQGRYRRTMAELTSPFEATAARVGMRYRPGFFVHGVGDLTDSQLKATAERLALWVQS